MTTQTTAEENQDKRPLRWAADAEGGAPYIFKDAKDINKYVGFEVDIATALEKQLGRKIEFVQYSFKDIIAGLERGDFDFGMNGVEVTPDRKKAVLFTRPYYIYTQQLTCRAGDNRFKDIDDCKRLGAVVGTMEDTAAERYLDAQGIKKRVYGDQVAPYTDCKQDQIDAVLLDAPIALYYGKPDPELKFIGKPFGEGLYAIALRKEDEELCKQLDMALNNLVKTGELQRIYEKWNLWTPDQEKLLLTEGATDVMSASAKEWTFGRYFPILCQGAIVTVELSFISMAFAVALGLPISMMRLYGPTPLKAIAVTYVEFFRGIPVLLLLFFIYFGLPVVAESMNLGISLKLPAFWAAVLGLGLNYAAYEAEIYRAGISSIPVGQWEAGISLGMTRLHTFRRIIFPQAFRVILPPMTNDFVALFKETSIVSMIAVEELNKQYQILAKSSLKYFEIGIATAVLYLIMSIPLGHLSRYLEQRWGKGR